MDKHLHIITHDIPFPTDYGGVVDLFYKIKALYAAGTMIHLHCFHANRQPQPELLGYCASVNYYPRDKSLSAIFSRLPYIVSSRRSANLLQNLQKDDYPVLLEGIHCSYLLYKNLLLDRKVFTRLHNVEHRYYRQLAGIEHNPFKKLYYHIECLRLRSYQRKLAGKAPSWAVSTDDELYYKNRFPASQVSFLPVFIPWEKIAAKPGKGVFCLYHGNLSVNENEKAAVWLLENIFSAIQVPFVIAGKNPSPMLLRLAHRNPNTCIVANPSEKEMQDLIAKAQVHILPSLNNTGVKLKLLNALFNGRHCIVNKAGVAGSGLESICTIAESKAQLTGYICDLFEKEVPGEELSRRGETLKTLYNNNDNARKVITWIY